MKKITLTLFSFFAVATFSFAQKKTDLLYEIEQLKSKVSKMQDSLAVARKNEKVGVAEAELYKNQASELQEANKTLLNNIKSFTQVSSQNSNNMTKTLEALRAKENQLSVIKDALSKNDSTAIVVLTNAKQTLGENANVSVDKGSVVITQPNFKLYDSNSVLVPASEEFLKKIATILNANPNSGLTIVAATSVDPISSVLQSNFEIAGNTINLAVDPTLGETAKFKIHPKYAEFYHTVREHMKALK